MSTTNPDGIFAVQVPMVCDCGHNFKISFIGLSDGDEIACPACDDTFEIENDTFLELYEQFHETVEALYEQLGHETPDDDTIEFIQQHNRIPTAEDLRRPAGYPVGLVGESNYQAAIAACKAGETVTLWREPGNPFDPRAIVAICPRGRTLGYIARDSFVQRLVHEEGTGCSATIMRLNSEAGGNTGVVLDLVPLGAGDGPIGERAYRQ